jgi:hypothetical protein
MVAGLKIKEAQRASLILSATGKDVGLNTERKKNLECHLYLNI